jgi:glycosyltransferase involved in cell wall biosynthesis
MTRLAKYFRVVWMQPPHEWRDAFHEPAGLPFGSFQQLLPGFHVYQPHRWLPTVYRSPWLSTRLFGKRLEQARSFLENAGCRKIVLYIWRPVFGPALSLVSHDLSCYHIDDEYTFSETEIPMSSEESRLLSRAGQVFIHSPALLEKKGRINPATHFVPNGVQYDAFASPCPEPADLAAIPRPRIGYAGYVKSQLDWRLLHQLAQAHPQYSFIFVGARSPNPELDALIAPLEKLRNTYFLGSKTAEELTRYPQHFDVCMMPYLRNDYTKYIYPLKLHEYLAGGKPVIGSRIRSLEEFGDVVGLATNFEEWSSAIDAALRPSSNTNDAIQRRQAVARKYDWGVLVRKIADTIAQAVGQPSAKL